MKAKEVTKKLSVNKTTIVNLKSKEMQKVNGGFPITSRVITCPHISTCHADVCLCP
jgi:hypothetical protein